MPPIGKIVEGAEAAAQAAGPAVEKFLEEGGFGGAIRAFFAGRAGAAADAATRVAAVSGDAAHLAPLEISKEGAAAARPGLEQWSHEIAAKLNVGQVTREQFDQAVTRFAPEQQELASAMLMHSLSNASDVTLMDNARSVGSQLTQVLQTNGFNVDRYMRGNSAEWRHMYTLAADSPGNLTAYLTRKAMNVEMGIRNFEAIPRDFNVADRTGWPIVITDDLSKATPEQTRVLSELAKRGDQIVNIDFHFGRGVNFMDFAKGTVHEKLSALVQQAAEKVESNPALASLSPKELAHEVLNGDADRAAAALGAKMIRPAAISEADLFKPPVSAADVQRHLESTYKTESDRNAAALILRDTTEYYDFKRMATSMQDLRGSILQKLGSDALAAEGRLTSATTDEILAAGQAREKDLLFVVGVDGGKQTGDRAASSSALMNHMYRTMNDLPAEQVVSLPQLESMRKAGQIGGKTVVYLDDAANEGVQIQKRLYRDLNQYPDVMVALIGSYHRFAQSFEGAEQGRSLVHLATYFPLKAERELQVVSSAEKLLAAAKTPEETRQWQELIDQVKDRARLLGRDGSGTFSISAHQIWPYFTADSATHSVRDAAWKLLKVGNPRQQHGYY